MTLAWKPIAVAFVLGGCVGLAVARGCALRMLHHHRGAAHVQQRMLNRFSSKLQLNPEQRSHVAAILETKRQKLEALRTEIRPRFEEIRTSTSAEIRQLLNPEQQKRFDAMEAEWTARMKRFGDHWKGPGEPGSS